MGAFSDLFARLDPDPRVRGTQFEHVCKWFLTNDPTYKNTLRRVWLWSEWTGRWGGDAGIDLVAEDHDGRLWAIQAKAYAPENTITKADVDKFLAESSRAVFSYRLLIATTDKLHHVARRTINDQEKLMIFTVLDQPCDGIRDGPIGGLLQNRKLGLDVAHDSNLNGIAATCLAIPRSPTLDIGEQKRHDTRRRDHRGHPHRTSQGNGVTSHTGGSGSGHRIRML